MPIQTKRQHLRLAAALAFLPVLTGCEDWQFWKQDEGAVSVFATHHREAGPDGIPAAGSSSFRRFENNKGWEIQLTGAAVVTAETQLARCKADYESERSGDTIPADKTRLTKVDLTCGSCRENFIATPDSEALAVGGSVSMPVGNYCLALVYFAPGTDDSETGEGEKLNTVELRGVARKEGEDEVSFSVNYDEEYLAEIDLSRIDDGGPLSIPASDQPVRLTISKVYDRFFDDVDFSDSDYKDQLEESVARGLEELSYATLGDSPGPRETDESESDNDTKPEDDGDSDESSSTDETETSGSDESTSG